jgi:hypothetical protein
MAKGSRCRERKGENKGWIEAETGEGGRKKKVKAEE